MAKLTIDGTEIEVPNGSAIIQACEAAGVEIPRFCYHERLSIAGNCRMCLVEVEKSPKPVASCAMPVAEGMVVKTDSPMVRNARRGVMEFLLINHPLDCPICDQGGECDLQDQAVAYGTDHSRYEENKRAVKDKNLGPLVKTVMTRCIQCTRCIRFATEIAGVPELGATARGESMEVGTYVEKALSSELSANIIDICPVGALTSKPYAFVARSWELSKVDSIDVLDAVGANIRIDSRGPEVLRILPRINEAVNEEWLADKSRFSVDGLKRRRLDRPWVRQNGKLQPATWADAFAAISAKLQTTSADRIGAVAGDLADCESMIALKDLLASLGAANLDCRQDGAALSTASRTHYLFNTTIAGIEQADAILIVGSNPRREAPLLNARIRKRFSQGGLAIAAIGPAVDLTYDTTWLGASPAILGDLSSFDEPFGNAMREAKSPMIIIGQGALTRPDGAAILAACHALAQSVGATVNVLHTAAARVGALDLGFLAGKPFAAMLDNGVDLLWLLGADEFDTSRIPAGTFVVYQGHHGDRGAARADVILPGAAYTEKSATWVNTEGRPQRGLLAVYPPGEAREDWRILRAFSDHIGKPLPYNTLDAVRARLVEANPIFGHIGEIMPTPESPVFTADGAIEDAAFVYPITNYYQTDPISRASPTMAACTATFAAPVLEAAE
jgi:NADH-quinone oxidoreductase subunit G